MASLFIGQTEAPEPILPESTIGQWLLSVGVLLVVLALVVALGLYTVRSRRLAVQGAD